MNFEDMKKVFEDIDIFPNKLNTSFGLVSDVRKFVDSHIAVLEAHPKNKHFLPFFNRLKEVCLAIKQLK